MFAKLFYSFFRNLATVTAVLCVSFASFSSSIIPVNAQAELIPPVPLLVEMEGNTPQIQTQPQLNLKSIINLQNFGQTLSVEEKKLADHINNYRNANGLPSIPVSKSLTAVAQIHARDMSLYLANPFTNPCNIHSWSGNFPAGYSWTPVCYLNDGSRWQQMANKGREVTKNVYTSDTWENSHYVGWQNGTQATNTADIAMGYAGLAGWPQSPGHNAVILNQDYNGSRWSTLTWQALGVGIYGGYAVMWVGAQSDPAGEVSLDLTAHITNTLNASYDLGESVNFLVKAESKSSTISKVELIVDNTVIQTSTIFPYSFLWTASDYGRFLAKVKVTDAKGLVAYSNSHTIIVNLPMTDWVTDSNAQTNHPQDITEFNNRFYQTHVGLNRRIYTRYTTNTNVHQNNLNKNDWTQWYTSTDPGEATNLPISMFVYNNRIYQVHIGTSGMGKIYTRSSNNGINWTGWASGNDPLEDTKFPVYSTTYNNKIYQTHVGLNKRIYTRQSQSVSAEGQIIWSSWITSSDLYEQTSLPVSIHSFIDNSNVIKLYQVHIGANKKIFTRSSLDGVAWSIWTVGNDPYESTNSPVFMSSNKGYLYQVHRGDGSQIFTRKSSDGSSWSKWIDDGGWTSLPVSIAVFNNYIYQGMVGINGQLYWRRLNE